MSTATPKYPALKIHVRPMLAADLPDVMDIQQEGHRVPTPFSTIKTWFHGGTGVVLYVADYAGRVVGFTAWHVVADELEVIDLVVHPEFRREKVGTQLLRKLVAKLAEHQKQRLIITVAEQNVAGMKFLFSCGLRWAKALRGQAGTAAGEPDSGDDAYVFERRLVETAEMVPDRGDDHIIEGGSPDDVGGRFRG